MPGKRRQKKNKEEARERVRLEEKKKRLLSKSAKRWYAFGAVGALLAFSSWIFAYIRFRSSDSAIGYLFSFIFSAFSIAFSIAFSMIAAFEVFPEKSELCSEIRVESLSILIGAVLGFVFVLLSRTEADRQEFLMFLSSDFSAIAFLMIFVQNGILYVYHLYSNRALEKELGKM